MSDKLVFISSTVKDLSLYRRAVIAAIDSMDGYQCMCMERFGARDDESDSFCRAKVRQCDIFVGIVGHSYGSSPDECEQSYTEREYDTAITASIPRLMFVAPSDFPMPANIIEPDDRRQKQSAFRSRIDKERLRDGFVSPDDLAVKVVAAIRNFEHQQVVTRPLPGNVQSDLVFQPGIQRKRSIQAHVALNFEDAIEHFTLRGELGVDGSFLVYDSIVDWIPPGSPIRKDLLPTLHLTLAPTGEFWRDVEQLNELNQVLRHFEGEEPIVLHIADRSGTRSFRAERRGVTTGPDLERALADLLGPADFRVEQPAPPEDVYALSAD